MPIKEITSNDSYFTTYGNFKNDILSKEIIRTNFEHIRPYDISHWLEDGLPINENNFLSYFSTLGINIRLILRYWIKNPPSKKVIKEIRKQIKDKNDKIVSSLFYDIYSNQHCGIYRYIEKLECYVYFGLDLTRSQKIRDKKLGKSFEKIKNIIDRRNLKEKIKNIVAGQKIAKFIKEAMNDEFEMKPLRTRIDLRKYNDLIKIKSIN